MSEKSIVHENHWRKRLQRFLAPAIAVCALTATVCSAGEGTPSTTSRPASSSASASPHPGAPRSSAVPTFSPPETYPIPNHLNARKRRLFLAAGGERNPQGVEDAMISQACGVLWRDWNAIAQAKFTDEAPDFNYSEQLLSFALVFNHAVHRLTGHQAQSYYPGNAFAELIPELSRACPKPASLVDGANMS